MYLKSREYHSHIPLFELGTIQSRAGEIFDEL